MPTIEIITKDFVETRFLITFLVLLFCLESNSTTTLSLDILLHNINAPIERSANTATPINNLSGFKIDCFVPLASNTLS